MSGDSILSAYLSKIKTDEENLAKANIDPSMFVYVFKGSNNFTGIWFYKKKDFHDFLAEHTTEFKSSHIDHYYKVYAINGRDFIRMENLLRDTITNNKEAWEKHKRMFSGYPSPWSYIAVF